MSSFLSHKRQLQDMSVYVKIVCSYDIYLETW